MSRLNKFLYQTIVRALSCDGSLWTPEGDAVCTVRSLSCLLELTFYQPKYPSCRADFIDQNKKFCCAVNGSQCDSVCTCWHFHFSIWNWLIWSIARTAEVCLSPDLPLPGFLLTLVSDCHRPLVVLAPAHFMTLKTLVLCHKPQVIVIITGAPLNTWKHLAFEKSGSSLQYSPPNYGSCQSFWCSFRILVSMVNPSASFTWNL